MADRGSFAWEIGAGQRFGDFLFISCLFFIPTEEKMWGKREKSRGRKSKHQGTVTCWRRGGRRREEEEPAKKQKWLEWWQVVWAGIESQKAKEERTSWKRTWPATRVKCLRETRRMVGLRNWTKLSLSEFSLSMAYSGQPDRGNSDLGTWQMWAHHVVHAGTLLWKGCHHIREGMQGAWRLCLHCLLITGLVSLK